MKKAHAQLELDIIKKHEPELIKGFAMSNYYDGKLKVIYRNEWRGRYGYCPSIYVRDDLSTISAMTPAGAYKYIWKAQKSLTNS